MTIRHEQAGLNAWTELCELCDWNELDALRVIERFVQVKAPYPTGRVRELCQSLAESHAAIKASVLREQVPES
jgi:hypothetical protein